MPNVVIGSKKGWKSGNERRHAIVQDKVFIGANTTLVGAITIGKEAVIGAGSVVLSDVLPHTTVAGVPACIIYDSAIVDQMIDQASSGGK